MIRLVAFLQAVGSTCAWICAAIFVRFWRENRDQLFVYFALAFTLIGISWAILSIVNPIGDASPYVYGIRLIAFVLIIVAVVVKNRETAR
jgi:hypothetical protein